MAARGWRSFGSEEKEVAGEDGVAGGGGGSVDKAMGWWLVMMVVLSVGTIHGWKDC